MVTYPGDREVRLLHAPHDQRRPARLAIRRSLKVLRRPRAYVVCATQEPACEVDDLPVGVVACGELDYTKPFVNAHPRAEVRGQRPAVVRASTDPLSGLARREPLEAGLRCPHPVDRAHSSVLVVQDEAANERLRRVCGAFGLMPQRSAASVENPWPGGLSDAHADSDNSEWDCSKEPKSQAGHLKHTVHRRIVFSFHSAIARLVLLSILTTSSLDDSGPR